MGKVILTRLSEFVGYILLFIVVTTEVFVKTSNKSNIVTDIRGFINFGSFMAEGKLGIIGGFSYYYKINNA